MMRFRVDGEPVAKGRPRVTRHGTYTPPKTAQYESLVRMSAKNSDGKMSGPIAAIMRFTFGVPKSASKKKQSEMNKLPCTKRPDLDNLIKSVLDALNKFSYDDDSSVCAVIAFKEYGFEPGADVALMGYGELVNVLLNVQKVREGASACDMVLQAAGIRK